jgi:hypothetical protein
MALGVRGAYTSRFSTHSIGGNFGATAAAAALAGLDARERHMRCPTPSSNALACPTGGATRTISKRRSTLAGWARATA